MDPVTLRGSSFMVHHTVQVVPVKKGEATTGTAGWSNESSSCSTQAEAIDHCYGYLEERGATYADACTDTDTYTREPCSNSSSSSSGNGYASGSGCHPHENATAYSQPD